MFRRITLCVLAASATLTATQVLAYDVSQSPVLAAPVVIAAPGIVYPDVGAVPSYPYLRHDPAWKFCQGEHRDRGRYYDCGPYSYHPYGAYGYRPNGTYRFDRSPPAYVVAPNAKIIAVETNN